jgi:dCMP deaminase
MEMKIWDKRFLDLAALIASWSKDPGTKVGGVIVGPDKRVVSVGFNGFPAGMPDDPELYADREIKLSRIVHAEINALIYARSELPKNATVYTYPFMPCDRCVVQLLQAGIRRYVAPTASKEVQERWGASLEKTRKYIAECKGSLVEYEVGN